VIGEVGSFDCFGDGLPHNAAYLRAADLREGPAAEVEVKVQGRSAVGGADSFLSFVIGSCEQVVFLKKMSAIWINTQDFTLVVVVEELRLNLGAE
jgi:hypothetical protein